MEKSKGIKKSMKFTHEYARSIIVGTRQTHKRAYRTIPSGQTLSKKSNLILKMRKKRSTLNRVVEAKNTQLTSTQDVFDMI